MGEIVGIVVVIVIVIVLVAKIFRWIRNISCDEDEDPDETGWRQSREVDGGFFKYNHRTKRYRYCKHEKIRNSNLLEYGQELWECPECGHTERRKIGS